MMSMTKSDNVSTTRLIMGLIPAVAMVLGASITLAQPYSLRYQFEPGTVKFKRMETTTALAQSNDGRSTAINRITTRYYTVTFEGASDGNIHYVLVQDTAVVDDAPGLASSDPTAIAYQNLLSGKRIRAVISSSGKPVDVKALDDLNIRTLLGPSASEASVLQEAFILPTLPERSLDIGMTWTEQQRDTLYPARQLQGFGRGEGIRMQSMQTSFLVESMGDVQGTPCLSLKWNSSMLLEDQTTYAKLEDFVETSTVMTGSLCFDTNNGRMLKSTVKTERESTRALFGESSSVVPSSTVTEMTLTYLP